MLRLFVKNGLTKSKKFDIIQTTFIVISCLRKEGYVS